MANCVECHRQIADGYAFCPMCGADNRPPEHREPVNVCMHQYVQGMPCCILCGAAYDEPTGSTPATRHRATVNYMLGGLVFALVLAYLLIAANSFGLPFSGTAHSLFGYTYTSYGRSSYGYYHSYQTNVGVEIAFGLGALAVGCFVQSFRLHNKLSSMTTMDYGDWDWWRWFWF